LLSGTLALVFLKCSPVNFIAGSNVPTVLEHIIDRYLKNIFYFDFKLKEVQSGQGVEHLLLTLLCSQDLTHT
jgi:hypothetical protein